MRVQIFALALLGACATMEQPSADAQAIVAAERAFALDAAERGWVWAFRRHHAPGAIVLQPDPIDAATQLATIEGDGNTNLEWRPAYAGISRSGDFGFTTGPFLFRNAPDVVVGHYFTVWRKQADGTWKWVFDAGTDVADQAPVGSDYAVPTLPVAAFGAGSAEAALEQVRTIEEKAATAEPLVQRLADEARVNRVGAPCAVGREAAGALMLSDGDASFHPLRREASEAGDLVFSLGEVHEGGERISYFARIWQRRREGWRIVFDEIVPRRT